MNEVKFSVAITKIINEPAAVVVLSTLVTVKNVTIMCNILAGSAILTVRWKFGLVSMTFQIYSADIKL